MMSQEKSFTSQVHKKHPSPIENEEEAFRLGIKAVASMCVETVYVIDFLKQGFHFVADRDFFLCGHSVEEAMALGYDFFPKVVHKKDLGLLKDIYKAIMRRLNAMNESNAVNYFSFSVRIRNNDDYLMVHHKLKPVFVYGRLRFGICLLSISAMDTPGHLRLYHSNFDFEMYSTEHKQWQKKENPKLSKREKNVLNPAKQGNTNREIAGTLNIGLHTLQNDQSSIYRKLNVHSMRKAVTYATNRHLLFPSASSSENKPKTGKQEEKKNRRPMTPEKLMLAQDALNKGQSNNSAAKQAYVSEFTIRYRIKTGYLKKR